MADETLSLDALVDLLHSVDHDKVANNKDAVAISDEALAALLDRSTGGAGMRGGWRGEGRGGGGVMLMWIYI